MPLATITAGDHYLRQWVDHTLSLTLRFPIMDGHDHLQENTVATSQRIQWNLFILFRVGFRLLPIFPIVS